MSGAMFPSYNSGKVIGEINWLEPMIIKSENMTAPLAYSEDIVIPINRQEINEFIFGTYFAQSTSTSTEVGINQILDYYSSSVNKEFKNLIGFFRQTEVGNEFKLSIDTLLDKYVIFKIVSEQEKSFVIKFGVSYKITSNRSASLALRFGWR